MVITANRLLGETLLDAGPARRSPRGVRPGDRDEYSNGRPLEPDRVARLSRADPRQAGRPRGARGDGRLRVDPAARGRRRRRCSCGVRGDARRAEGRDARPRRPSARRWRSAGRPSTAGGRRMPSTSRSSSRVAVALAEAAPLIAEVDAAVRRFGYGLRRARIDAVLAQACASRPDSSAAQARRCGSRPPPAAQAVAEDRRRSAWSI